MVLCPVRGDVWREIAAFLRKKLGLNVICQSPEQHDRDMALSQGLTHLIAQILMRLEPFPDQATTPSFDLLRQAIDMVRNDSPDVYHTIERDNPFAAPVREEFFKVAQDVLGQLDGKRVAEERLVG